MSSELELGKGNRIQELKGDDCPLSDYEYGRLARQQNCYRLLSCFGSIAERDDWYHGWDDMDRELCSIPKSDF